MSTYVVFDSKSGRIVHTHTEAGPGSEASAISRDDVLEIAHSRLSEDDRAAELDVLDVAVEAQHEGLTGRKPMRVDVESRSLVKED